MRLVTPSVSNKYIVSHFQQFTTVGRLFGSTKLQTDGLVLYYKHTRRNIMIPVAKWELKCTATATFGLVVYVGKGRPYYARVTAARIMDWARGTGRTFETR